MIDKLIKLLSFFFFLFGLYMVYKEIKLIDSEKIFLSLKNTSVFILVLGSLATILNFIILSFYDKLGLLYLKKKLSFLKTLKISALSFAVSNLAGHTYASGGAIRYLFLRPLGFKKKEILLLVTLISLFSIFGLLGTLFLALLLKVLFVVPIQWHHPLILYFSGIGILMFFLLYFKLDSQKEKTFQIKNEKILLPQKNLSFKGLLVGCLDLLSLFLVFYIFLNLPDANFLSVLVAFILASFLAFLSQVPAGIGVFESSFLSLFPHTLPQKENILLAFILFRVVYYIFPFLISISYFLIQKLKTLKNK